LGLQEVRAVVQRRLTIVLLVVVALAGCSGVFGWESGGGDNRETLTPVPPVTTAQPTPTERLAAYDGVSPDGSIDRRALLGAHLTTLANASFTVRWSRWRSNGSDRPVRPVFRQEAAVENASTYRYRPQGDPIRAQVEKYGDPSGRYGRWLRPEGASVTGELRASRHSATRRFADIVTYGVVNTLGNPDVVRPTEQDGQRYLLVVSRTPPRTLTDQHSVRNYSATMYVHPDGYIRSLTYQYDFPTDDGWVTVRHRFAFRAVGETTVRRPEWVESLTEADTPTPISADIATPNGTETAGDPAGT
jgi:hypothetical protein